MVRFRNQRIPDPNEARLYVRAPLERTESAADLRSELSALHIKAIYRVITVMSSPDDPHGSRGRTTEAEEVANSENIDGIGTVH